jgi:hypothetical protein
MKLLDYKTIMVCPGLAKKGAEGLQRITLHMTT